MSLGSDPGRVELILQGTLRNRSRSAILASVSCWILTCVVYFPAILHDPVVIGASAALMAAWSLRYWILGETETMRAALWLRGNSILVLAISFGWAVLIHRWELRYGDPPSLRFFPIILGCGLVTGSAYSLSMRGIDFFDYVIPILVSVQLGFYQTTPEPRVRLLGLLLLVALSAFIFAQRKEWLRDSLSVHLNHFKLQTVMDSFPGGILVSIRGKVIQANAFFSRALLSPGEGIDRILIQLLRQPVFRSFFEQYEKSREPRAEFEATIETANGTRAYLFLLDRYLPELENGVIVVGIDIQARKEHERTIETQRAQLEYAGKMTALGEMAAGIAHEINNPLLVILGNAQLSERLLAKPDPDARLVRTHQKTIVETVERIAKITRGLLAFARGSEEDPFETVKLKALVEDTVDLCSGREQSGHLKIEVEPVPESLEVEVRPAQITQVLVNLLNNSFDAVAGLKAPWIRISCSLLPTGERAMISITDSGPGLDPRIRERIMQPFLTTKPVGKGTGLGLSISHGIVRAHHGEIYFDSGSGNTRVVVVLPLRQAQLSSGR